MKIDINLNTSREKNEFVLVVLITYCTSDFFSFCK
jgi:hypothetical protein